jgi:phage gp29-like protein
VAERPDFTEIASSRDGRDITLGYVSPLDLQRPQDSVLQLRGGGDYRLYQELLRDDQVAACLAQRRLAVVAREWEVRPGGTRRIDAAAADFLRAQLAEVEWDRITSGMLYGVFYGFAVAEALYAREGRHVALSAIKVRNRRRFGWDGLGRLRLLTTTDPYPGEAVPARKFWAFSTGADHDDEPYGLGLAHWLYWPVFFKRNGVRLWLTFLEKFGAPTARGTYPASADSTQKQALLAACQAVATDSAVVLPEGMAIELLEAARSGTADYVALYDRMDRAIAKVVLGQTLTSEAVGGQYKAEVQMDVRQDLVKADADLVCQSFNRTVARWLTEWNYPGAAVPLVWRKLEEPEDLTALAERYRKVFDIGFRPTLEHVTDEFGGAWELVSAAPPATPTPEFAEPEPPPYVPLVERLEAQAGASWDTVIARIREEVDAAADLADLLERIERVLPELGTLDALAQAMAEAFTAAELAGRYDILEQAGG